MNKLIVVDVEADGPCPGEYSMVCFGACIVERVIKNNFKTFYGECAPISSKFIPEALAVSGFSRIQHEGFIDPNTEMANFTNWLKMSCGDARPIFISDNPAFDWQFMNYYLHRFTGKNPFGFSARRIGDIYCGIQQDLTKNSEWKKLRNTKHDHHPVNDAMGNAEALIQIIDNYKLKIGGILL